MAVMIGIDPHKASHIAVALDEHERPVGELRVRSAASQVERLVEWAATFTERTWAIEGAGGLGYLLAQQLVVAGERVVDVAPTLAARGAAVGHWGHEQERPQRRPLGGRRRAALSGPAGGASGGSCGGDEGVGEASP